MSGSPWDMSNDVLYNLCRAHPLHQDQGAILTKILLIGRVYAAAIERRRQKQGGAGGDAFYMDFVEPMIRRSAIDDWLRDAGRSLPKTAAGMDTMLRVHANVTELFNRISGLDKRSLASKYLHFHVPELFFIYDSRAVEAIREFSDCLPRATHTRGEADNEYRKFAQKAAALTHLCEQTHGLAMSPRQLDNLLLGIKDKRRPLVATMRR